MRTTPPKVTHAARGVVVGYVRVSTDDQNTARQLHGVHVDKTFTDRASGRDTDRPKLDEMLRYLREGDTLIVHSMDRLARNVDDLRALVRDLTGRGVAVQFIRESLTFTGDDSPISNLLLSVLGAVAQFERELIHERQLEGVARAKARGAYKGRRPSLTADQAAEAGRRLLAGESATKLGKEYGVNRHTIYRRAAELKQRNEKRQNGENHGHATIPRTLSHPGNV
jgi:DNA invertase Pin-like site-specific DNA recombinase